MKKILVLGAGMVSRPMIQYLLDQPDFHVVMASRTVSKAEQMIGDHPQGDAFSLDVNDDKKVDEFVSNSRCRCQSFTLHVSCEDRRDVHTTQKTDGHNLVC